MHHSNLENRLHLELPTVVTLPPRSLVACKMKAAAESMLQAVVFNLCQDISSSALHLAMSLDN